MSKDTRNIWAKMDDDERELGERVSWGLAFEVTFRKWPADMIRKRMNSEFRMELAGYASH